MDKHRYLAKLSELEQFHQELQNILPDTFKEYKEVRIKRSCERVAQLLIEVTIDICSMLVRDHKLGLPSAEKDILTKLEKEELLSKGLLKKLDEMKRFRNLLIHRYGTIDDQLTYKTLHNHHQDFEEFKEEILKILNK